MANIIDNFTPFSGQHCETTATGSLLKHLGIDLTEPMLFGLGEGLSFIFWNMKIMDFPFIGGRVKPDVLTQNICSNLNLQLDVKETSSIKKAWENVKGFIDNNIPVGLKLDSYHLEYFSNKIHFAGHYVAMYGYDNEYAWLVDTMQQGSESKTSLKSLELARNEKGPMSSRNRSYTIKKKGIVPELKEAITTAIRNNAVEYLNPPIKNISYKGILKTSVEIKKWFKSSTDIAGDFKTTAMLMEKAGTGGAIFRNIYRNFLKECSEIVKNDTIYTAREHFVEIAEMWTNVSDLLDKAGDTEDIAFINQASGILAELSSKERVAMELLSKI
jgi:hypothetical protein